MGPRLARAWTASSMMPASPSRSCSSMEVSLQLSVDPQAVVVPTAAVQASQQGQYVFVVKTDQTVELRPVTVARSNGTSAVIKDGVKPGETVVTDGQLRLVPGSHISVKDSKGAEGVQKAVS